MFATQMRPGEPKILAKKIAEMLPDRDTAAMGDAINCYDNFSSA